MIRNLLLDWSGTLADDLGQVIEATNAIFRHYGRPGFSREDFRRQFRLPFSGFYAELLPEATEEGLDALYERFFRELHGDVCLLPGALEFLAFCREEGIRTFLLSTIKGSHFEAQAGRLGVRGSFEHVYVEIHDKRERVRDILATHGLDPSETAFVGDMVHDIEAAHHGGVLPVAVLTGFDDVAKLLPARPAVVCEDLRALQRLLGSRRPAPR